MLAGDGSIGVIGPIEVGDAKLYVDGFVAGAASVDPDLEVGVNYTDSFCDTALAAEAATSFIDGGATVLSGTAQMTVGAIGVASERGVLWFGTQLNQTELAPEIVVANQVYHWDVVLADLIAGDQGRRRSAARPTTSTSATAARSSSSTTTSTSRTTFGPLGDDLIAQLSSGELTTGVGATDGTEALSGTDAPTRHRRRRPAPTRRRRRR